MADAPFPPLQVCAALYCQFVSSFRQFIFHAELSSEHKLIGVEEKELIRMIWLDVDDGYQIKGREERSYNHTTYRRFWAKLVIIILKL